MKDNKNILNIILLTILLSFSFISFGSELNLFEETDHNGNLRLGNDYIVIVTNTEDNGRGRFAIETTGGAPFRSNDDDKSLVYGRPKPWTSYTTFWINGETYVFGGKTGRRAGKNANYGKVIDGPYVRDGNIYTETEFNDGINVQQILTIVKNSTTGLFDSVQIKYRIKNTSEKKQKVGMRLMLDTMLGENDGAPFRIGNEAVTTDTTYYKKQLPEFYQAFDSISNPNVTSQGTFTGPGVTTPDKVMFADWGSLADSSWNFDNSPGEEFIRKGEYDIDSAMAMYWVPEFISPGETRTYITKYGLGGITIVPGLLSLGVTSPAEFVFDSPDKSFPIIAYIENTSEITTENVNVEIDIPEWLAVDSKNKELGDLEPGDIAQVIWNVKTSDYESLQSSAEYEVNVNADNTDKNKVKREVKFIGPPNLEKEVNLKQDLSVINGRLIPNPFTVELNLSNTGGSTLHDVSTEILLPPGLSLASKEKEKKYPENIKAGENINISWRLEALKVDGKLPFAIDIRGLNNYKEVIRYNDLNIPELKPLFYFNIDKDEINKGDYITVDIMGENVQELETAAGKIKYNTEALKLIYFSRGTLFLRNKKSLPWRKPKLLEPGLIKINESLPVKKKRGTLASIHFKVLNNKDHSITWNEAVFNNNKEEIDVIVKNYKF
ncbi:MAG: hypothetical protein ACOCRZ_06135 [Halothermotrichaceae bacterium]